MAEGGREKREKKGMVMYRAMQLMKNAQFSDLMPWIIGYAYCSINHFLGLIFGDPTDSNYRDKTTISQREASFCIG